MDVLRGKGSGADGGEVIPGFVMMYGSCGCGGSTIG
ncbi:unnamed protein product [Brassica rapa subsp. narinosa]